MTCNRTIAVVLILIFVPLLVMGIVVPITLIYGTEWSDAVLLTVIFAAMAVAILLTLWAVKNIGSVPCTVTIDEAGIEILLGRSTLIFPHKILLSRWSSLAAVSSDFEPKNDKRFYKVQFREPRFTLYLTPSEKVSGPDEETAFGALMMGYVEETNRTAGDRSEEPIETKGFYQGKWARIIAWMMWIFTGVIFIGLLVFPEKMDYRKVAQFSIAAGAYLTAYYIGIRRKKR